MQRTLRNLAIALAAGSIALAVQAQDKAEKVKAAPTSNKIVVNGVTIPPARSTSTSRSTTPPACG